MIRSAFHSEVRGGCEELAKCFPTPSGWQLTGSEALQMSADGSQQFDLIWIPVSLETSKTYCGQGTPRPSYKLTVIHPIGIQ